MTNNTYTEILEKFINSTEGMLHVLLFDRNGNSISSFSSSKAINSIDQSLSVSSAVTHLSTTKLIHKVMLGKINDFLISCTNGTIYINIVDLERILLTITNHEVKPGLVMLNISRMIDVIGAISYTMPTRKENLEKRLQELENDFIDQYKIFISYAKKDSQHFEIPKIGEYLEKNYSNVEVMYFEKSIHAGEKLIDYMERGVNWCNVFVWFHSKNSMTSAAVQDEYKMAKYLGKNIISITEDFNSLPLSARVTWALNHNPSIEEMCTQIIHDIENYDLKKIKFDFYGQEIDKLVEK